MRENPNWTWVRISSFSVFAYAWIKGEHYSHNPRLRRCAERHFHFFGLTNRFTPPHRSDPLVLDNLLRQWQDLSFLTSGISIQPFQGEFKILTDASTQGWGAQMGNSQISGFGPVPTASSTSTLNWSSRW